MEEKKSSTEEGRKRGRQKDRGTRGQKDKTAGGQGFIKAGRRVDRKT